MDIFQSITTSVFFGSTLTFIAFAVGNMIKQRFKKDFLNPILIAIIIVVAILLVFDIDYELYSGSANFVSYMLTPTTICLALPLYKQLNALKQNIAAILIGIITGALTSMSSIFLLATIMGLTQEQYVTLLPKSITTAIGLPLTEELGGVGEIAVAVIILTGIAGNLMARQVLRLCRVNSPIAKGIAIGSSSHAIGTVKAMELGEVEGAMSSLSIAISGIVTVVGIQFFAGLV